MEHLATKLSPYYRSFIQDGVMYSTVAEWNFVRPLSFANFSTKYFTTFGNNRKSLWDLFSMLRSDVAIGGGFSVERKGLFIAFKIVALTWLNNAHTFASSKPQSVLHVSIGARNSKMVMESLESENCVFISSLTLLNIWAMYLGTIKLYMSTCWSVGRFTSLVLSHRAPIQFEKRSSGLIRYPLPSFHFPLTRVRSKSTPDEGDGGSGFLEWDPNKDECFWPSCWCWCFQSFFSFQVCVPISTPSLRYSSSTDASEGGDGVYGRGANEHLAISLVLFTLNGCCLAFFQINFATGRRKSVEFCALGGYSFLKAEDFAHFSVFHSSNSSCVSLIVKSVSVLCTKQNDRIFSPSFRYTKPI